MTNKNRDSKEAPGFLFHSYSEYLEMDLPAPLANELAREKERKTQRERKRAERERKKLDRAIEAKWRASRAGFTRPDQAASDLDEAVHRQVLEQQEGSRHDPTCEHEVYSLDELVALRVRAESDVDRDRASRLNRYADDLVKRGLRRPIAWPSSTHALQEVAAQCPNFREVVDIVRSELAAARRAGRAPQVPPLLLLGDPGIGKTHFCRLLASALGAPHHQLCYDSPIAGSALAGVDPQWGTAKPGVLIDAVCASTHANPLFVLDEIDKALRSRNDDPLGPLHTLLERSSARQFRDIFIGFKFDASLVTWIATANTADRIPSTIRSRFTEITIGAPTAAEAIEQAIAIMREIVEREAPSGFARLQRHLCVQLAHLTPREMKSALSAAIRRAVENDRNSVERQDLPNELFDEETQDGTHTWLH